MTRHRSRVRIRVWRKPRAARAGRPRGASGKYWADPWEETKKRGTPVRASGRHGCGREQQNRAGAEAGGGRGARGPSLGLPSGGRRTVRRRAFGCGSAGRRSGTGSGGGGQGQDHDALFCPFAKGDFTFANATQCPFAQALAAANEAGLAIDFGQHTVERRTPDDATQLSLVEQVRRRRGRSTPRFRLRA